MSETTRIEYDSNNSGGSWWLSDKNWEDLAAAGWEVSWYAEDNRFIGALATKANRYGLSLEEAVAEWEEVTGCTSTDAGCPCCGQPHTFTEYDGDGKYVRSGPDIEYTASW